MCACTACFICNEGYTFYKCCSGRQNIRLFIALLPEVDHAQIFLNEEKSILVYALMQVVGLCNKNAYHFELKLQTVATMQFYMHILGS